MDDGGMKEADSRPYQKEPAAGRHILGTIVTISVIGILVAGVVLLFVLAGDRIWYYFRSPTELRGLVRSWGPGAPLGIILLQLLQVVVAPLPGNVVSFATGYALGFWPGIVWVMAGVMIGATVDFMLARLLGRRLMRYLLAPDRLARLDEAVIRRGTFYIFLLMLVPNPIGDLTYYLAGLTPMPVPLYLALVFVGKLPSNVLECWLGERAVGFGLPEWGILAAVAAVVVVLYFTNQRRIANLLERWSHLARRPGSS